MYRWLRTSCLSRVLWGLCLVDGRTLSLLQQQQHHHKNVTMRTSFFLHFLLVADIVILLTCWMPNKEPFCKYPEKKLEVKMLQKLFSRIWIFRCCILVKPTVWCGVCVLIVNPILSCCQDLAFERKENWYHKCHAEGILVHNFTLYIMSCQTTWYRTYRTQQWDPMCRA